MQFSIGVRQVPCLPRKTRHIPQPEGQLALADLNRTAEPGFHIHCTATASVLQKQICFVPTLLSLDHRQSLPHHVIEPEKQVYDEASVEEFHEDI